MWYDAASVVNLIFLRSPAALGLKVRRGGVLVCLQLKGLRASCGHLASVHALGHRWLPTEVLVLVIRSILLLSV